MMMVMIVMMMMMQGARLKSTSCSNPSLSLYFDIATQKIAANKN
jgi:hypothetical protein